MKLFGGSDRKDTITFLILVVSGINLGLVGITGRNFGMSIFSSYFVFVIVAVSYLASALYLYQRWSTSGQKIF